MFLLPNEKRSNSLVWLCTLILDLFSSLYSFSCVLGCGQTRILADPQTCHVFLCFCAFIHMVPFTWKVPCFHLHTYLLHTLLLANSYSLMCHLFSDVPRIIHCVSKAFCLLVYYTIQSFLYESPGLGDRVFEASKLDAC